MTAQFVEIAGHAMAVLPRDEFKKIAADAEKWGDLAAAVAAEQRRADGEEYMPANVVDRLLAGEHPLKVWREHRGMTATRLGEIVGRGSSMISKLEKGKAEGGIKLWKSIADALEIDLEDLVPSN